MRHELCLIACSSLLVSAKRTFRRINDSKSNTTVFFLSKHGLQVDLTNKKMSFTVFLLLISLAIKLLQLSNSRKITTYLVQTVSFATGLTVWEGYMKIQVQKNKKFSPFSSTLLIQLKFIHCDSLYF